MRSHVSNLMKVCLLILFYVPAYAAVLPLEGRLPATPGGSDYQAYFDPNLDITWSARADDATGSWDSVVASIAGLIIGGVSGWRLPSMDVNGDNILVDCRGGGVAGCSDNEMGFFFSEEGISSATPGPFVNILSINFWSGTEYAPDPSKAWSFYFFDGSRDFHGKNGIGNVWAVHDGDVGAVPLPATFWLFGSGLLGLIKFARCNKT